jgi:3-dehydroquinate dehydratase/shikimate dehydrogenase
VCKSSSHLTHNFAFKKLGLDAVYVKLCVNKTNLEYCLALCRVLGFKGLSVTMPLKEEVTRHIDHCESKAVNTIGFRQEGVFGWNTDGRGALDALEKKGKVLGKKVVLLGAGGAAWGIAQETKKRGGHLVVLNRTLFRAQELAKSVGGLAFPLTEFAQVARSGYDILINCTSVGMDDDKSLPVPTEELLEKKVVMEIVVSPRVTPLVAAAKEKKCEIVEGIEMFIQQAVGQYRYWFQEHLLDD